jgi:hypothetical protein
MQKFPDPLRSAYLVPRRPTVVVLERAASNTLPSADAARMVGSRLAVTRIELLSQGASLGTGVRWTVPRERRDNNHTYGSCLVEMRLKALLELGARRIFNHGGQSG